MPNALAISGELVSASAAVAGLILVFLGFQVSSFASYQKQEQRAVLGHFRPRAWLAFAGFVFSLISTTLALVGKWLGIECLAFSAMLFFALTLIMVFIAAVLAVREIR